MSYILGTSFPKKELSDEGFFTLNKSTRNRLKHFVFPESVDIDFACTAQQCMLPSRIERV